MHRPKTGATHYLAYLGLSNNGQRTKGWLTAGCFLTQYPGCLDRKERFGSPKLSLVIGTEIKVS